MKRCFMTMTLAAICCAAMFFLGEGVATLANDVETVDIETINALGVQPSNSPANPSPDLPAAKKTKLGLYATAVEAYKMWSANPGRVVLVDCRTPQEYYFVGHATAAVNIPSSLWLTQTLTADGRPVMTPNPEFVKRVKKIAQPNDVVLVYCRSGQRSAGACDLLAEAGFTKAYTITDGFEGDPVAEPDSAFVGKRVKNGWKNAGLPWTSDIDPTLVYDPKPLPEKEKK